MSTVSIDATTTVGKFTVTATFETTAGITALFGPSGSGKSVTLATIAGLLRPTAGTVTLRDRVVADPVRRTHVPTQQRHLGMVFQHAALLPHRSPLDNVALGLCNLDRARRRHLAQQWLDRVHAGHLAYASTSTLSGGEQQRVALARALVSQPALLLLDEPFSALDQTTRVALRRLVRELVDENAITAILVTHDLDDITTLADRIVLYEPGRTIATHELSRDQPFQVARLLGLTQ
jgi:molybdate transport system ATP-binding protein